MRHHVQDPGAVDIALLAGRPSELQEGRGGRLRAEPLPAEAVAGSAPVWLDTPEEWGTREIEVYRIDPFRICWDSVVRCDRVHAFSEHVSEGTWLARILHREDLAPADKSVPFPSTLHTEMYPPGRHQACTNERHMGPTLAATGHHSPPLATGGRRPLAIGHWSSAIRICE